MRLFAGLPLPESAVERLAQLRLRLAAPGDGLRWSAPEAWHITLCFYGEVDPGRRDDLLVALRGIQPPGPRLALSELGLFQAKGILYAAAEQTPELMTLQAEVERCTRAAGELPGSHPFRPHVTMARSKGKTGSATLRKLSQPVLPSLGAPIRWRAEDVLLYQSVLGSAGAHYEVLHRQPLATDTI